MRILLRTTLLLAVIFAVGCGYKKSRDFFAASGISVGEPVKVDAGEYRIPMEFKTKDMHSGQWIDIVKSNIKGSDILVTAVFTQSNRQSRYPGYIEISSARGGVYALKYRDPDGTLHPIQAVTLP
ncbi:hypothetical protein [Luteolibacter sp. AS25]|uniref:hypothetical protein n=1 Tax=Luteolibacter sp. AS25 TaxID=3135776 RepID=UPI00398BB893